MNRSQWLLLLLAVVNLGGIGILALLGAANLRGGRHPTHDLWSWGNPGRVYALLTRNERRAAAALGGIAVVAAVLFLLAAAFFDT
jgi:hypothetical protein